MLVALPDQDASACGGWLFDYEFDPAMKNHAVISKRWRFRGSYLVNKPVSAVEKRKNIESLLGW
jgi:hypothetical protein